MKTKLLAAISLIALAALSTGCAFTPAATRFTAADATADTSCRRLVTDGRRDPILHQKDPVLCGDAAQWAEFDPRAALINAGVTCRQPRTPSERCMTTAQWNAYDAEMARRIAPAGFHPATETVTSELYPGQGIGAPWPPSQCCLP